MRKDKRDEIENFWMITYSDMITIVLCFFILLFTITSKESSLLSDIKATLNDKVGLLQDENEKLEKENKALMNKIFNSETEKISGNDDFIKYLSDNNLLDDVDIIENGEGVKIRFKNSVLFGSGQEYISEEGKKILEKIAVKISNIDNNIRIEGFTDNVKTNMHKYKSNWELSVARAISVVRFFVDEKHMNESRMSVIGWGEQKPIASNDTDEGKKMNRRIEITILN